MIDKYPKYHEFAGKPPAETVNGKTDEYINESNPAKSYRCEEPIADIVATTTSNLTR
jgi:hypothetical protein